MGQHWPTFAQPFIEHRLREAWTLRLCPTKTTSIFGNLPNRLRIALRSSAVELQDHLYSALPAQELKYQAYGYWPARTRSISYLGMCRRRARMETAAVPHYNDTARESAPHWGHCVQFYGDDSSLLDELSSFIGTELLSGDAAVVIATKTHRDGLLQRLQSRGLSTALAVEQGRYIALDAEATLALLMRDGSPDADLFRAILGGVLDQAAAATRGKPPRIAAFGEMVALLWARGDAAAGVRLEQLWNNLARTYPLSLRCAYPMTDFSREDHSDSFLKICAEHSQVIPVESYRALLSEEERFRSITHLQQKAQALEAEMAQRKQVEEELRRTKADLEFQVEQRTAALRQLSARLLSLQDSERRRIARELHDSLGQYLVGLKLNAHMLRQSPERQDLWSEADNLMEQCMSEVRTLSYLLHPPTMDAAGFASAARWYVGGYGER